MRRAFNANCAMAALTAAAWLSTPASAEEIDLSPRFEQGAVHRYEHSLTMTQKKRVPGFEEGTVSLQLSTALRFHVTRVREDGGADVELTFDRITIDAVPSTLPRFEYDTELDISRENDEWMERAIRRVAESAIAYTLDRSGQVERIVGAREIERLISDLRGFELLSAVWTQRWFREVAQDVFNAAGDRPHRDIGDVWTTRLALALGGYQGSRTTVEWTLKQVRDGVVVIEGKGTPQPPVVPDEDLIGVDQKVSGDFSRFSVRWDPRLGRSRSVEKSEAMSIELRQEDWLLATATFGTHSLLRALDLPR